MSNTSNTNSDPPLVELVERHTKLSIVYDVVRLLPISRFDQFFEPARRRLLACEPAEDHSDVPMLAVPINFDPMSKTITEVREPVEYWSTPNGGHTTLDKDLYPEHTDENEVVFHLDYRGHAETPRQFRYSLLLNLMHRKTKLDKITSEQELNEERVSACDICGINTEGTGHVHVSAYPDKSDELSTLSFNFCTVCGDEILELLSSFEPINQPTSRTPYKEIFMQSSNCGFCSNPMKEGSLRAGVDFLGPITEQSDSSDRAEELYAICPDCHSVFSTFIRHTGVREPEI